MIRVLLLEHLRLAREGLSRLIDGEPEFTVTAAVGTLEDAIDSIARVGADVAVVNFDMAELPARDVARAFTRIDSFLRIVGLTSRRSDTLVAEALDSKILGFALKQEGFLQLRDAIRTASRHEYHYSAGVIERLAPNNGDSSVRVDETARTRLETLTPRELQLLRLLASGLSLKAACQKLHVTYKTADKHKVNLMRKLEIHDRVELARFAIRENIIEA